MARIAIIYRKRIKDHSCIACAKCYKAIDQKDAEFAQHDETQLAATTDCGDCPGLVVP
jgi:predicted metal-binding protein